eukprot:sb/3461865/
MKLILPLSTLILLISLAASSDRSALEDDLNKYCMDEPSCITEAALDMYYFIAGEGFGEDQGSESGPIILNAVVELVEMLGKMDISQYKVTTNAVVTTDSAIMMKEQVLESDSAAPPISFTSSFYTSSRDQTVKLSPQKDPGQDEEPPGQTDQPKGGGLPSVLLSPVTPRFISEESMGFDGLSALNIITPTTLPRGPRGDTSPQRYLDSTQVYLDLLQNQKISPPRRKQMSDREIHSTQCYFDLVRDTPSPINNKLRRRLFVEGDEKNSGGMTELLMVARGARDDGPALDDTFEDDFSKTELLARDDDVVNEVEIVSTAEEVVHTSVEESDEIVPECTNICKTSNSEVETMDHLQTPPRQKKMSSAGNKPPPRPTRKASLVSRFNPENRIYKRVKSVVTTDSAIMMKEQVLESDSAAPPISFTSSFYTSSRDQTVKLSPQKDPGQDEEPPGQTDQPKGGGLPSVLLSPVTPRFISEESMGFDGLSALNIITPTTLPRGPRGDTSPQRYLDSTQVYLDLLQNQKISPPRRKQMSDREIHSTQCYFDLVRDTPSPINNKLRRRLFVEGDEKNSGGMTELLMVARGARDDGPALDDTFEDDFSKTELLARDDDVVNEVEIVSTAEEVVHTSVEESDEIVPECTNICKTSNSEVETMDHLQTPPRQKKMSSTGNKPPPRPTRKASLVSRFNPENRIYKRVKSESPRCDNPERIEAGSGVLVEIPDSRAQFLSYPPPITQVVPIPVSDAPVRRKATGLLRRSVRLGTRTSRAQFLSYPPPITQVVPIPVSDAPVRRKATGLLRRSVLSGQCSDHSSRARIGSGQSGQANALTGRHGLRGFGVCVCVYVPPYFHPRWGSASPYFRRISPWRPHTDNPGADPHPQDQNRLQCSNGFPRWPLSPQAAMTS